MCVVGLLIKKSNIYGATCIAKWVFLIRFVEFTSNHIVVVVVVVFYGLQRAGNCFHCGVVRFQPLTGPDRGSLFYCRLLGSNPLTVICSIIFHNSQTPNARMCTGVLRRVTQKNVTTCQQRRNCFAILGVSFCAMQNAFNIIKIKNKNIGVQFSKSSTPLYRYF